MSDTVLLLPPGDAAARAAVEWVAAHLVAGPVLFTGRPAGARPIGRLEHSPFAPPPEDLAAFAAQVVALLTAPEAHAETGPAPGGGAADPSPFTSATSEAAVLAVLLGAPLLVSGSAPFRDLVRFSAWSMNVPSRPTDALLVRHAAIAARAPGALLTTLLAATPPAAGPALAEALARGDVAAMTAAVRTRRRAARADGPIRFRRIAAKSAGLRPFTLYLDLVPALAARGAAVAPLFAAAGPERGTALLGMSIAIFL